MRERPPMLVAALGALLVVAGLVVFVSSSAGPAVVVYDGSYPAPDPDGGYDSTLSLAFDDWLLVAWSTGQALGVGLVVVGLLVLASLGGWLLGRRRTSGTAR